MNFEYEKYSNNDNQRRAVRPEARSRWYLMARDTKDEVMKSFGLDRITDITTSPAKFKPIKYDVEKEYQHSFERINGTGTAPIKVVLSFTPTEGKYIESLPLHHSQQLVLEKKEERRFEYYISPRVISSWKFFHMGIG